MRNQIIEINNFIKENRWIDIEFKNINHNKIVIVCSEDLDFPLSKSILITFLNPSYIKSNLWIRNTLNEISNTNFISIVSTTDAEQIMGRKLDEENKKFNLPAETLFKIKTDDDDYSYIVAENISYQILN